MNIINKINKAIKIVYNHIFKNIPFKNVYFSKNC